MSAARKIALIGAPLDLGQGRRGVDMGPSALRYAGLLERLTEIGHDVVDWGNIETAILEASSIMDDHAKYLPEIKAAGGRIARLVRTHWRKASCRSSSVATSRSRWARSAASPAISASAACSGSTHTPT